MKETWVRGPSQPPHAVGTAKAGAKEIGEKGKKDTPKRQGKIGGYEPKGS